MASAGVPSTGPMWCESLSGVWLAVLWLVILVLIVAGVEYVAASVPEDEDVLEPVI